MNERYRQWLLEGERLGQRYSLAIPQSALAGRTGTRLGRRPGSSIEFQEYRDYQPGDDLRAVDWAVYGRTDRLTVKLFREEVNPHIDILLDGSRSMDLDETAKLEALLKLAGLFAAAADNSQCTHAAWISGNGFRQVINGNSRPAAWDGLSFDSPRTVEESLHILAPRLRRLGLRVLLSDLMWPGDPANILKRLTDGAASVTVVQLLAQTDANPPAPGNLRLVDSESGQARDIYIDAAVQKRYSAALARHQSLWREACRKAGAAFAVIVAEQLETNLHVLEEARSLAPA